MNKYIVWIDVHGNVKEPEVTRFNYGIGDMITVSSSEVYKCVDVETELKTDIVYYHFKQGKRMYVFDY
ncbi:hypothetical protein WKH56_20240 [Priestia sp. SB1]|uniref:hypothetical protein n=1 Tax=Priestia sp. SB1 TaxID=3132359 RepID=UPI00316E1C2E